MDTPTIFLIGVGLSMDCVAVAIASGLSMKKVRISQAAKMGMFFGAFQGLMPMIGWILGLNLIGFISGFVHWIAFAVLSFIGIKMIYETIKGSNQERKDDPLRTYALIMLSLATSTDALAVGLSFSLLGINIFFPSLIIGTVCFSLSAIGALASSKLGEALGSRMKVIGGLVLIIIGVRILTEYIVA